MVAFPSHDFAEEKVYHLARVLEDGQNDAHQSFKRPDAVDTYLGLCKVAFLWCQKVVLNMLHSVICVQWELPRNSHCCIVPDNYLA